jgi:hypothetical protein
LLQALPLSPEVKRINPNGVAALAKDVGYLINFVNSLENAAILRENLDELQQTVTLMQTDNPDEFYDVATRNKKFGRVDALNGPRILEKYVTSSVDYPSLLTRLQAHPQRANPNEKRAPSQLFVQIWHEMRVNPASSTKTSALFNTMISLSID